MRFANLHDDIGNDIRKAGHRAPGHRAEQHGRQFFCQRVEPDPQILRDLQPVESKHHRDGQQHGDCGQVPKILQLLEGLCK